MKFLQKTFSFVLSFIFADTCVVCKKFGSQIHTKCVSKLTTAHNFPGWLIAYFDYSDPAFKKLLMILKQAPRFDIAKNLTKLLVNSVKENISDKNSSIIFIPIPASKHRKKKHGFNQAHIITSALASHCLQNILVLDALYKTRKTQKQSSLSKKERAQNMKNVFAVNQKYQQTLQYADIIFVIDDVCTTGSTLQSAQEALQDCNKNVKCVSLAFQPLD